MKKSTWLFLLLTITLLTATSVQAKNRAKHVVLIGLDGWGAYSVESADIPHIKKLMEEGCYTLKKRSVLPSSSAVNWASMFRSAASRASDMRRFSRRCSNSREPSRSK